MRVPVVIDELIVGIVLGTTGFQVINPNNDILSFLVQIGFALVMFVAGSHVPIRQKAIACGLHASILRALEIAIVAIPVGMGISALFSTGHGTLYAVLIASSSANIIMPALGTHPSHQPPRPRNARTTRHRGRGLYRRSSLRPQSCTRQAVVETPDSKNDVSEIGPDTGQESSPEISSKPDPRADPPHHQEDDPAAPSS